MRIDFKTLINTPTAGHLMKCSAFCRYKGGGGIKKPKKPKLSELGEESQGILYGDYTKGMNGEGLTPSSLNENLEWLEKGYNQAQTNMEEYLDTFVDPNDTKVREFSRGFIKNKYNTARQGMIENEDIKKYTEQKESIARLTDAVAGEKRMATSVADMYNQAAAQMNQMPSFWGELGTGVGQGAAWIAPTLFGKGMSNNMTNFQQSTFANAGMQNAMAQTQAGGWQTGMMSGVQPLQLK